MTRLENRIRVAKVDGRWGCGCDEHGYQRCWDGVNSRGFACKIAHHHWRLQHAHRAQGVCQRCGDGRVGPWEPDTVEYAADLCDACQRAMDVGAE